MKNNAFQKSAGALVISFAFAVPHAIAQTVPNIYAYGTIGLPVLGDFARDVQYCPMPFFHPRQKPVQSPVKRLMSV